MLQAFAAQEAWSRRDLYATSWRSRASLSSNPEAARLYSEAWTRCVLMNGGSAWFCLSVPGCRPQVRAGPLALASAWSDLGYDAKALERPNAPSIFRRLSREERLAVEAQYREIPRLAESHQIYRALTDLFPDNLNYGLRLAARKSPRQKRRCAGDPGALRKLPLPTKQRSAIDLRKPSAERMRILSGKLSSLFTARKKGVQNAA